jgi:hypothetical protein
MLNFNSIYCAIVSKLTVAKNKEEGFKILENKILTNPHLKTQYNIFSAVKEKRGKINEIQAKDYISSLDKYTSKLNYTTLDKSNKALMEFFNINPKEVKVKKIDAIIDGFVRFNSGGALMLENADKKIKENLFIYLTTQIEKIKPSTLLENDSILGKVDENTRSKVLLNIAAESYNKLSSSEQYIVEAVANKRWANLNEKLKVTKLLASYLKESTNKTFISACLKKISSDIKNKRNIKESAYSVYELQEQVKQLVEAELGGDAELKVGTVGLLTNIVIGAVGDSKQPDTVYFEFRVKLYPQGNNFNDVRDNAQALSAKMSKIRRNVVNQFLYHSDKYKSYFQKSDVIFNFEMRTKNLKVGDFVVAKCEFTLPTVQDQPKPLMGFVGAIKSFATDISTYMQTYFAENLEQEEIAPRHIKAQRGGEEWTDIAHKYKFSDIALMAKTYFEDDPNPKIEDELSYVRSPEELGKFLSKKGKLNSFMTFIKKGESQLAGKDQEASSSTGDSDDDDETEE